MTHKDLRQNDIGGKKSPACQFTPNKAEATGFPSGRSAGPSHRAARLLVAQGVAACAAFASKHKAVGSRLV